MIAPKGRLLANAADRFDGKRQQARALTLAARRQLCTIS
jgi:hypothetical protein